VRRMFVALRQHLLPGLSAQWLQIIQLLIQPFRPAPYPRLRHLLQPCTAVPRRISFCPAQGTAQLRYNPLIRFITRVRSFVIVR
jgi:hypothetical protein